MYLAFGVGGRNKYIGNDGDIISHPYSGNKSITYGKFTELYEGAYSRLNFIDYGFNFPAGFKYKNFQIYSNYGLGLKDVSPKGTNEKMGENRVLTFGAGYIFHL